jgi:hypothetical protein
MTVIRIRSALTAQRHALAAIGAIVVLGLAVAVAHGTPGDGHLSGLGADDSHAGYSAAISMCLAVVGVATAGAGLLAPALLSRRYVTRRADRPLRLRPFPAKDVPTPSTRAGPSLLQVYRL